MEWIILDWILKLLYLFALTKDLRRLQIAEIQIEKEHEEKAWNSWSSSMTDEKDFHIKIVQINLLYKQMRKNVNCCQIDDL